MMTADVYVLIYIDISIVDLRILCLELCGNNCSLQKQMKSWKIPCFFASAVYIDMSNQLSRDANGKKNNN